MGKKHKFSDELEQAVADALEYANIEFTHGSQGGQRLDFYLPKFDVYIEVKKYHSDRISAQMASAENVIAVQGKKSVDLIVSLFKY